MRKVEKWVNKVPILDKVIKEEPTVWINPGKVKNEDIYEEIDITIKDIIDADRRLRRFAPLLM
ncbi:MAG TPA: D-serine ammonia-lyase, partial [Tissierellaceae bacterium]|nr:D-serine ammonia-lyase [Tissierellaceae bacterium]